MVLDEAIDRYEHWLQGDVYLQVIEHIFDPTSRYVASESLCGDVCRSQYVRTGLKERAISLLITTYNPSSDDLRLLLKHQDVCLEMIAQALVESVEGILTYQDRELIKEKAPGFYATLPVNSYHPENQNSVLEALEQWVRDECERSEEYDYCSGGL